ncbi:MAG: hypothetical protein AB1815_07590 [Bacillota bacterium]
MSDPKVNLLEVPGFAEHLNKLTAAMPEEVTNQLADLSLRLRDICVQEVLYQCFIKVDCELPIFTVAGAANCRGEAELTDPSGIFTDCRLIVTCADEELFDNCRGVRLRIGVQIVLTEQLNSGVTRTLVLDRTLFFNCIRFFPFPIGTPISGADLAAALRRIDGSCIVIDLNCEVLNGVRPRIRIFGKIIDKLWKEENLWILAARPYRGITVKQEFPEPHRIGPCDPRTENPCPFTPSMS